MDSALRTGRQARLYVAAVVALVEAHGRRSDIGQSNVPVGFGARPAVSDRTTIDLRVSLGRWLAASSQSPPNVLLDSNLVVDRVLRIEGNRRVEVRDRLHRTPNLNPSDLEDPD